MEITVWKKQACECCYYEFFCVGKCIVLINLFFGEIFYIIKEK